MCFAFSIQVLYLSGYLFSSSGYLAYYEECNMRMYLATDSIAKIQFPENLNFQFPLHLQTNLVVVTARYSTADKLTGALSSQITPPSLN